MTLRVLRVYHAGRDPGQRQRDRALVALGLDLTLIVPAEWSGAGSVAGEAFPVLEVPVHRPGDVNRHRYRSNAEVCRVIARVCPDLIDVHEEPFSLSCRQWLAAAGARPVVAYTAQNVDKRFPPPFAQYERAALQKLRGLYPCTRQAASVVRGKGFPGLIEVLPLGFDNNLFREGAQSAHDVEVVLGLVGRLVPEKGVLDAVRVLAALRLVRPARLLVVGTGPELGRALKLAAELGVAAHLQVLPWQPVDRMAELFRGMHVVLLPSRATATWVEQFGRVLVEAQASGAVVVGYRSGAIPEVAADSAVLVPEGDGDALAAATVAVLGDPVRFDALRGAGKRHVEAMSWRVVAGRQLQLYERVLSATPTPTSRPARPTPGAIRLTATEEFGPPAVLAAGAGRPFALPVLRRNRWWTRTLAAALDAASAQGRRISRS